MIKQAEDEFKPQEIERQVREFWARAKVYPKAVAARSEGEDFSFIDGPPYTTGSIHLGLVLGKTLKDTVLRWRRMHGYNVRDQPGYDMHGLPIEVQVEKTLGIANKKEIEDLGIGRFVDACREFAVDLLHRMNASFQQLGVWMDWDHPYMTITNDFIEAAWWTLQKAHAAGLLYEALRSIQWCSRCETALADAEVEYSDETDPSIYVKFPAKGKPDESFLIWTTTPWTLPANLAIAAHPAFTYAKVKVTADRRTEYLWMLESNVGMVTAKGHASHAEVVERASGEKLVGREYVHPLAPKVPAQARAKGEWVHKIVASETVEAEHTGLVHTAPGHGPEDFELGQRLGLPVLSPVDERGRFTPEAGAYAGRSVREAAPVILDDLRAVGALFADETLTHSYGHCWRCRTPVLFRATTQWFLKVTAVKPKMLEEVARVAWTPDWAGSARQRNWTENLRDWTISRQRYWGIPLPIWRCSKCAAWTVAGSVADLKDAKGYTPGMDLHRPGIDGVTLRCAKCGGDMVRVKDILDVWFDSGVASWASLGFPGRDDAFQRWWPADWIEEGPDQTRGWFNSQLAAGVVAFGRAPYERVLMHGWVNGPDGRQMHRHLGNYVDADVMMSKYGVDPLRFYVLSVNAPWEDITFQEEGVRTAQRTLNILWNVLRFATTYMSLDRFDPSAGTVEAVADDLQPEDRWLLSRLEGVRATVEREMEAFNLHRAQRAIESFVLEDLSRWYVKLARERTWIEADDRGKAACYATLFEALRTLAVLLGPATPHLAEAVYQRLDGRVLSVHMLDAPQAHPDRTDADLEASMAVVQELVEAVSKERQKGGRKLRWPVRGIAVQGATPAAAKALASLKAIFLAQANAKELSLLKAGEAFPGTTSAVRPDVGALGKAHRALAPKVAAALQACPPEEVRKALDAGGLTLAVEGHKVKVDAEMVRFEEVLPADVAKVATPHGELYLDLRMSPEVRQEGYAREIVRRIQQMRKDLRLEVDDFVVTVVRTGKDLAAAVRAETDLIARETRSRSLTLTDKDVVAEHVVEWKDIDGQSATIGMTPLHMAEALREFRRIPGVTAAKATALFDAGYKTAAALRAATRQELAAVDGLGAEDAARIAEYLASPPPTSAACPWCGTDVEGTPDRCPRCGEPLGASGAPCARCGTPVPPGAGACAVCGLPLSPAPAPAAAAGGPAASPGVLRAGATYLVLGDAPDLGQGSFTEAMAAGRKGLWVTRLYPQRARDRLGRSDVPILWLSNVGREEAFRPKDLDRIAGAVDEFLARGRGVVLLDGVEYLLTNNNFLTVLRFLQGLRDRVAVREGVLLVCVSPSALEPNQRAMLEKEVEAVIGPAGRPAG